MKKKLIPFAEETPQKCKVQKVLKHGQMFGLEPLSCFSTSNSDVTLRAFFK